MGKIWYINIMEQSEQAIGGVEKSVFSSIIPNDLEKEGLVTLSLYIQKNSSTNDLGKNILDIMMKDFFNDDFKKIISDMPSEEKDTLALYIQSLLMDEIAYSLSTLITISERDVKYRENIPHAQQIILECKYLHEKGEKVASQSNVISPFMESIRIVFVDEIVEKFYK